MVLYADKATSNFIAFHKYKLFPPNVSFKQYEYLHMYMYIIFCFMTIHVTFFKPIIYSCAAILEVN